MMNKRQQERFDEVCKKVDQYLFEHSVIAGIDESVMNEYAGIIEEVSGKDICAMAIDELNHYKHGALIAEEKAKK